MATENKFLEMVRHMRMRTMRMEHEGDYWTKEEQEELRSLFNQGTGITEIAIQLQRTEPAVIQQIEKLDLYQRKQYPKRRRIIPNAWECLCPVCKAAPHSCPRFKDCLHKKEVI